MEGGKSKFNTLKVLKIFAAIYFINRLGYFDKIKGWFDRKINGIPGEGQNIPLKV